MEIRILRGRQFRDRYGHSRTRIIPVNDCDMVQIAAGGREIVFSRGGMDNMIGMVEACNKSTPSEWTAYRLMERLRRSVNAACTCGGMGPADEGVCPACMVWHGMAE